MHNLLMFGRKVPFPVLSVLREKYGNGPQENERKSERRRQRRTAGKAIYQSKVGKMKQATKERKGKGRENAQDDWNERKKE